MNIEINERFATLAAEAVHARLEDRKAYAHVLDQMIGLLAVPIRGVIADAARDEDTATRSSAIC